MTEYNTLRSRQMERKREILNNEKKLAFLKLDALELEIDNFHGSTQQQQKRRRSPPPLTNQQQQQQQQPYIMPDIPLTNYRHDQRGPMNPLPYHNDYRPNNNNNSQRQRSPLRRNTNIRNNNNNNNNNARNLNNTGRDRGIIIIIMTMYRNTNFFLDGKRPLQDVFPTQNDHNKKARINEHEEPVITRTIENENFTQPENQILLTPSSPKKNTPRYKSHSSSSSSSSCSSHDELGDYY